ncbi:MAG: type 1 glutamine amidotransferase [Rubricoccaceae bacterium]|nr:type 1 glutamine amidotransferase [Rubricoccaceae bacterium]
MAPTHDQVRVRLIQIRVRPDILDEEQASFAARTRLRRPQILSSNAVRDPLTEDLLDDVDAVLIGGAGAYSVTHTYSWTDDLIQLCQGCAERRLPLFGSCWGHQFIARAFGGVVVNDPTRVEMGTLPATLTAAGRQDPLFAPFPKTFYAQMGHHDRVATLPEHAVELATSEVAPHQAFRLGDLPIYGTQFHSELDRAAEEGRLRAYREHYPEMADDDVFQDTIDALRETPDVDNLLYHFVKLYAVEDGAQAA